MKEYAFLVEPTGGRITASDIHLALAETYPHVSGVTTATHTEPWLVILHTNQDLSTHERDDIQAILNDLAPAEQGLPTIFE